jgi:hypothetical protein
MTRKIVSILLAATFAVMNAQAARMPPGRKIPFGAASRDSTSSMSKFLRRDLLRDRATRPRTLSRDRVVDRYTSFSRAEVEYRKGLASGTHLTTRVRLGHPASAQETQRRFGLPIRPQVRERVLLKKGTAVRFNKALGGAPGVGEITIVRAAPQRTIKNIQRIR